MFGTANAATMMTLANAALRPAGPAHVAAVSDGNHHSSRPDDPLRIQTQDESRFLRLDYVNTIVEHLWAGGQMIAIAKRI